MKGKGIVMARNVNRVWSQLQEDTRQRFRDYIFRNQTVETQQLAEELCLAKNTVASLKAWATMTENQ